MMVADTNYKDSARYRIQVSLVSPRAKHAYDFSTQKSRALIQADVAKVQDTVLPKLNPYDIEVLTTYGVVFGFSATSNQAGIEALASMAEVTHIDAMQVYRKLQTRPGDREGFPIVNMDAVHDAGHTGNGMTIAIIDDGLDTSHPAFAGKILGGFDFGDNDADFNWDQAQCPDQTHGTGVAGVAAGKGGNILGTAPDAKIVFYKIGSASECEGLPGDVAAAVDRAVQDKDMFGIRVMNLSFGAVDFIDDIAACEQNLGEAELNAYRAAHAAGIVIFASSGNEASCNGIIAPACLAEVISVGSVYDSDIGGDANCYTQQTCVAMPDMEQCPDEAPFFAQAGTAADQVTLYTNSGSLLDILAPSENALTARAGGGEEPAFGGTSSASPFAAGVGAVLIAANGQTPTKDTILGWLRDTGVMKTDPKNNLSRPRIDALAALNSATMGSGNNGNTDPITVSQRWIAHITPTAAFVTSVQVTNRETTDQAFTLTPYDAMGNALTPVMRNAAASTTTFYSLTELFGNEAVSHLRIGDGDKVTVSVGYQASSGAGSPATAAERGTHGNKWRLIPGAWNVVFDGFAAVNLGDQATDVQVTQKATNGSTIATLTPITGLAPNAKGLFLLNNDFTEQPNTYFDITATQALAFIAIRFEKPAFNFLWENLAILLTSGP